MAQLEQIKADISSLPPEQIEELGAWVQELRQAAWDRQLDSDNASSKLDFLFEEADDELAGRWPPQK